MGDLEKPRSNGTAMTPSALILIGYVERGVPWTVSVILGGVGLFLAVGAIIHGRILAGRCQQEIDSLQNLKRDL
jgi:hypothetical protein